MSHEKLLAQLIAKNAARLAGMAGRTLPDFSGSWTNELQSTMDLAINGSAVSGTYTSIVSNTGATVSGPIIGYVVGDVIAFSVLWPASASSITSWVGQIVVGDNNVEQLDTLWHMIVNGDDAEDPASIWTTIHAGADQFHR